MSKGHDVSRANRVWRLLQQRFARTFVDHRLDLLAAPTTPIAAVPVELEEVLLPNPSGGEPKAEYVGLALLRLTAPANLAGLPAISVPAGFTTPENLPFGLQLMARPFDEPTLLAAAHLYEQAAGRWRQQPPLLATVLPAAARGAAA